MAKIYLRCCDWWERRGVGKKSNYWYGTSLGLWWWIFFYFFNLAAILKTTYLPSRLEKHAYIGDVLMNRRGASNCSPHFTFSFCLFCVCSTTVSWPIYVLVLQPLLHLAVSKCSHFCLFWPSVCTKSLVQQAMFHRFVGARHLATLIYWWNIASCINRQKM